MSGLNNKFDLIHSHPFNWVVRTHIYLDESEHILHLNQIQKRKYLN